MGMPKYHSEESTTTLTAVYYDAMRRVHEASGINDAIAHENSVGDAYALSGPFRPSGVGSVIREMRNFRLDLKLKIHEYYHAIIEEQHTKDTTFERTCRDSELANVDTLSMIINRYIYQTTVYSYRDGPLTNFDIQDDKKLDYDPIQELEDMYNEVQKTMFYMDLGEVWDNMFTPENAEIKPAPKSRIEAEIERMQSSTRWG